MTDEELQTLVAENSQGIAELNQTLGSLISDVIQPLSRATVASQERAEENARTSLEAERRSVENAELFRTLLGEAREDRMTAQRRFEEHQKQFDAQQEIIQSLLLQFTESNSETDDDEDI